MANASVRPTDVEGILDPTQATATPNSVAVAQLLPGDGSTQVAAALLAWGLLAEHATSVPAGDPQVQNLVESLCAIPAYCMVYASGSGPEALLARVGLQNTRAQVRPLDTLDWVSLLHRGSQCEGLALTDLSRGQLKAMMEDLMQAYHTQPDVAAYAAQPRKGSVPNGGGTKV